MHLTHRKFSFIPCLRQWQGVYEYMIAQIHVSLHSKVFIIVEKETTLVPFYLWQTNHSGVVKACVA